MSIFRPGSRPGTTTRPGSSAPGRRPTSAPGRRPARDDDRLWVSATGRPTSTPGRRRASAPGRRPTSAPGRRPSSAPGRRPGLLPASSDPEAWARGPRLESAGTVASAQPTPHRGARGRSPRGAVHSAGMAGAVQSGLRPRTAPRLLNRWQPQGSSASTCSPRPSPHPATESASRDAQPPPTPAPSDRVRVAGRAAPPRIPSTQRPRPRLGTRSGPDAPVRAGIGLPAAA